MLSACTVTPSGLDRRAIRDRAELTDDVLWLDMGSPTEIERQWVREVYGHEAQYLEDLSQIEASARCFRDQHGQHLRLYFLQTEETVRNVDVGFTIEGNRLFTLHAGEVKVLRSFHTETEGLSRQPTDALSILTGINELRVALLADVFERLHTELDTLSGAIFSNPEGGMQRTLQSLGRIEDINGKGRLGMIENRRALSAFAASLKDTGHAVAIESLLRDADSLMSHSQYLFDKADFLMDAALGMIDIQHSKRLGIFTVLSVVLMPPTLIASIYGMNFRHMPELSWIFGYPLALVLMLAVAIGPVLYLRHKDWL